jgi:hypothetical protein
MRSGKGVLAGLAMGWSVALHAGAATLPFTEEFSTGDSEWRNPASAAPVHVSSGGRDGGGFIRVAFDFEGTSADQSRVVFRGGTSGGPASGGAFVGDWIDEGVGSLTAWVRHDAAEPITFFARFAAPANFPGATAVAFAPVAPGPDWTQLFFAIDPTNPQFVSFEGSDFDTVFSDIGIVQIGLSVPAALAGQDQEVSFDLDTVGIAPVVPEPALSPLLLLALAALRTRRPRRAVAP